MADLLQNDNFVVTVPKGSVLYRADGTIILDVIPENVFSLWKDGEYAFTMKKTGAQLLENFSKEELEKIFETRKHLDYKAEIKLLQDAIKASEKQKNVKIEK